jgi:hypothetical protein
MTVSRASLARRGWVVPLCVVLVTVAAVIVAGTRTSYYRTSASVVVSGQGTAAASPAVLAATYASLIQQDQHVANAIAQAIHVPAGIAAARLSATAAPHSAIITLTYSDPSSNRSWNGVWVAQHSVIGAHPKAAGIPPHLLRVVSGPGSSSKQSSKLPGGPVPIGIVLGLFLGVAWFLAWERSDARADDGASLEQELGLPVSEVSRRPDQASITALPHRWAALAGKPSGGAKIVLVDATLGSNGAGRDLTATFTQLDSGLAGTYVRAHVPGTVGQDDVESMTAEFAVLVVARGEPLREIRRSIAAMRKLGVEPRWALLVR